MATNAEQIFLNFSARKLEQFAGRIGECLARLSEEQVWARGRDNENAVGNLVLHLAGNVRQWIVSGIGGKPDVRVRDREFSARGGVLIPELLERLDGSVREALEVIRELPAARLLDTVVIQGFELPVLEAIYHVVEHFAMHTGQIMFATKAFTGEDLGFYRHLKTTAAHGEKTP